MRFIIPFRVFYKIFIPDEKFPRGVDLYAVRETKIIDDLKAKGYKSDFVFFPMAVNAEKFNLDYKSNIEKDNKAITFLFLGMLSKRKGLHYVIQAFNLLCQKYKNVKLIIAGEGAPSSEADFKKLAGDNKKIEFVGKVVGNRRLDYYAVCDVFVSDALGQFGIYKVHIEAMAMGKPVILSKKYDTINFENSGLGISINHGNIEELSKAMEHFILYPSHISQFGKNARQFVEKNTNFSQLALRIRDSYSSLLLRNS